MRLLLLGIIPALLIAATLSIYNTQKRTSEQETSLRNRGSIIAQQLAIASAYGIESGNITLLQYLADTLLKEHDIASIKISDANGKKLVNADNISNRTGLHIIEFEAWVVLHQESNPQQYSQAKKIGQVHVSMSLEHILEIKQSILLNNFLITSFGLLITAYLANRLGTSISAPINQLTQTVKSLAQGNLEARADFFTDTEIEELRLNLNKMARDQQKTKQYLERQIDNATLQLRITLNSLKEKILSLEQAKELAVAQNEIKSQFLAHISHEIRTPMNSIIGFAELLSNSALSLQQAEHVHLVKNSAHSLITIVNEILDYSSLESGKFKISVKPVDLYSLLEETISLLNSQTHNLAIVLYIEPNFPESITTDPIRFKQVVTNLLGNAIKFTEKGHIVLRCHYLSNDHSILVTISDTGPGIPENIQNQLFAPFLQLSEYAINAEIGTGLGLTISKNIVEGLNGDIGFITQQNIGSTFWFNIPVPVEQPFQNHDNRTSICIIDSLSLRCNAFSKQLIRAGYQITKCVSEQEFFQQQSPFDVIFLGVPEQEENNPHFSKSISLIKSKSQAPLIVIKTYQSSTTKLTQENSIILPSSTKYINGFIESVLQQDQHQEQTFETLEIAEDYSILVADDNEINRLLLQSQLSPKCNNITLVNDGREAVDVLQAQRFDLILLDLQMPILSGIDVIKLIKRDGGVNAQTPCIAITAHARPEQRKSVIEAGFDECLIKPIQTTQLYEIIDLWLPRTQHNSIPELNEDDYIDLMLDKTKDNKELALILFNKLFEELPEQVKNIDHAIKQSDFKLAQKITHNLHGSVSFCGLIDIQQPAKILEILLLENDLTAIQENFQELHDLVFHFVNMQHKVLNKLQEPIL